MINEQKELFSNTTKNQLDILERGFHSNNANKLVILETINQFNRQTD